MQTAPQDIGKQYIAQIPDERREAVASIREVIDKNLPKGYASGMQYNMLGWFVPHEVYPAGYHCDPKQPVPFCGLANQKGHISLYAFFLYCDEGALEAFEQDWQRTCPDWKLDMGKSCVRFKKMDQIPLAVIGRAVKRATLKKFLASYTGSVAPTGAKKSQANLAGASKKATKKTIKKTTKKTEKKTAKRPGTRTAAARR